MKTVVWERVKGTVSALPVPFIGRDRPGGRPSLEEDEVEQALRQVVGDTPDVEQPLLQSTNAERYVPSALISAQLYLYDNFMPMLIN